MSIFFDYRKRKPRVWTCAVFIIITLTILGMFLYYGKLRADEREKAEKLLDSGPRF